jgi:hypothetical protein
MPSTVTAGVPVSHTRPLGHLRRPAPPCSPFRRFRRLVPPRPACRHAPKPRHAPSGNPLRHFRRLATQSGVSGSLRCPAARKPACELSAHCSRGSACPRLRAASHQTAALCGFGYGCFCPVIAFTTVYSICFFMSTNILYAVLMVFSGFRHIFFGSYLYFPRNDLLHRCTRLPVGFPHWLTRLPHRRTRRRRHAIALSSCCTPRAACP